MRASLLAVAAVAVAATAEVEDLTVTKLTQCQMYRLAVQAGIPASFIPQMVCTALYESRWTVEAVNHNTDGSTDRGLWQVNNRYW